MTVEEKERIYNCVVIPDGYWKGFDKVARIIEQHLNIKFKYRLDDLYSYYWVLDFKGVEINLHYHERFGDVELFTEKKEPNNKLVLSLLSKRIKTHLN